jgi:hypothetical protein
MQDEQVSIPAAWIRFPKLLLEKSEQRYKRLGKNSYEYKSKTFKATLKVDEYGVVERYGDIWELVSKYVR